MVAVVKNGSVVGPCCWWQSFGRYEGSRCPISLIFRSLASSYSNIKANQLGFLLKQSVGSSLWCRLSVSSSIGLVDRSLRSVSSIGFGGSGRKISFLSSITMPVRGNALPAVSVAGEQSRRPLSSTAATSAQASYATS